jgi:hypothetical protein
MPVPAFVVVHSQPDLLKVVLATDPAGGFAHLLNSRQKQTDQHGDNRDGDEQFDQGEGSAWLHGQCLRS